MTKPLPIYLHTLRKKSGFSQREVAFLLGISSAMLSKLERLERQPAASIVIAVEIIFGVRTHEAFPSLYENVETKVGKQALLLFDRLEVRNDVAWTPKFAHNPCMINRTNIQAYEKASHRSGREGTDYQSH